MLTQFTKSCILLAASLVCLTAEAKKTPLYPVGYSTGINKVTVDNMQYAKKAGIDYIEIGGLENICNDTLLSDGQIKKRLTDIKKILDDTGIQVWSIHMPFSKEIDLSNGDEKLRRKIVDKHKRIVSFSEILNPKYILFHPSFYLGLNERPYRINQMVKSVNELLPAVEETGAEMVIENMLGYELLRDENRERPLCRTVDEMVLIMNKLPRKVGVAVDTNHIKYPEKLISAFGKRIKTLHICDGDGKKECHYMPCSGEGENDWNKILYSLEKAGYKGVFMFESKYKDVAELPACYEDLRNNYQNSKKN
ncbi:MAG: sugar phosphate isomerase/epimerase family protein [Bacteroidales bacterium]